MKRWVKNTLTVSLCLIPIGLVIGFSNSWSNKTPISCVGSSGVKPFVEKLAKEYMDENKNVDITVEAGGSGFGIEQVAKGYANIGDASKDPYSAVQPSGENGFRQQWEDNKIKTITIGWEAICLVYIPPKGFEFNTDDVTINNILSIDEGDVVNNFMRIFSGIDGGTIDWRNDPTYTQNTNLPPNSMYWFRNQNITSWPGNDEQLLKDTSIIPYVRAGGSLTSGTAASFINGTHFDDDPYQSLNDNQKSAFDSGQYGVSFGIQQTDEANSRAWDMFKKSNNPGQIVYLSSGFVSQNLPLIEKNGYGIMAYNSQQYEISKVDTASGYNWFRPLNTLLSVSDQTTLEVVFIHYLLTNPGLLSAIGCKELSPEELLEMFPDKDGNDFGEWYSDYDLSTIEPTTMHNNTFWAEEWPLEWNFAPHPLGVG